jgi:hypothetical protein
MSVAVVVVLWMTTNIDVVFDSKNISYDVSIDQNMFDWFDS